MLTRTLPQTCRSHAGSCRVEEFVTPATEYLDCQPLANDNSPSTSLETCRRWGTSRKQLGETTARPARPGPGKGARRRDAAFSVETNLHLLRPNVAELCCIEATHHQRRQTAAGDRPEGIDGAMQRVYYSSGIGSHPYDTKLEKRHSKTPSRFGLHVSLPRQPIRNKSIKKVMTWSQRPSKVERHMISTPIIYSASVPTHILRRTHCPKLFLWQNYPNMLDAYYFICSNFNFKWPESNRIILVEFSRGASCG